VADEDAEAIANVEKLTGAKIKVFGKEDVRVELADPAQEPEREEQPREAKEDRPKKPRSKSHATRNAHATKKHPTNRAALAVGVVTKTKRTIRFLLANGTDQSPASST
jgi:hypothetical protein